MARISLIEDDQEIRNESAIFLDRYGYYFGVEDFIITKRGQGYLVL